MGQKRTISEIHFEEWCGSRGWSAVKVLEGERDTPDYKVYDRQNKLIFIAEVKALEKTEDDKAIARLLSGSSGTSSRSKNTPVVLTGKYTAPNAIHAHIDKSNEQFKYYENLGLPCVTYIRTERLITTAYLSYADFELALNGRTTLRISRPSGSVPPKILGISRRGAAVHAKENIRVSAILSPCENRGVIIIPNKHSVMPPLKKEWFDLTKDKWYDDLIL